MKVCVIGGGIIGLFSAYYLSEAGYEVAIVDKGDFSSGTSYGNAGMICPSHFIPLAAPGVITQSIKWMFDASSPFYIKPSLDPDLLRWCLSFFKHSTASHVRNNIGPLSALLNWSRDLYIQLSDQALSMDLKKKGIIMVCNTTGHLQTEINLSHQANRIGIRAQVLSKNEIEALNPGTTINALGGVHYLDDMHVTPHMLMASLKSKLKEKNIEWLPNTEVTGFKKERAVIKTAISTNGDVEADQFVIAAGSWSSHIAHLADCKILIQPGKGYNVTIEEVVPPWVTPMILVEGRVAVTPMGQSLRLGGTMEIGGFNDVVLKNRIQGILNTIHAYLPDLDEASLKEAPPWFGYRPLSSTGLPLISRLPAYNNLFLNAGHGMLGLSLGPASGLLLTQLMNQSLRSGIVA
ncbi:MAG: FAD-dependent oxidoreductase [Saprospiraceae bacterium]|nr:FAD-dependent oxidoreductase [Saprospiraceae bacterium]MBK8512314.1 FAD-dependent oxidoreductase [Saprospiraceae bacterium]MBP8941934.1 FAD-dependent oxidoreductase [Saprospiraceae bacterium]